MSILQIAIALPPPHPWQGAPVATSCRGIWRCRADFAAMLQLYAGLTLRRTKSCQLSPSVRLDRDGKTRFRPVSAPTSA